MSTTTLNSSVLKEASYDSQSQRLTLTFNNDTTYTYEGVGENIYRGLINADSAGRFFGMNISGKFTTTRG